MATSYAELHSHSNFSFLHGASTVEDMTARAAELGLAGLAVTDHDGLYGVVRFTTAANAAGVRPVIGIEIELIDAAAPDPTGIVVPARRVGRTGARAGTRGSAPGHGLTLPGVAPIEGLPARPRPERARLPGHRAVVKEDLRGIAERQRGPHLVLLARDATGYRSLCRLVSRANLDGTKRVPRFTQELLELHSEGLLALSGGRDSEIARRLLVGDRAGARAVAERYAAAFGGAGARIGGATARRAGMGARGAGRAGDSPVTAGFFIELSHHLLPDDDWLVAEHVALAAELGLPVVVTNDAHYARPEDREMHDILTGIFHGRTLDTLGPLRRPDGESYLKSGDEMAALPPGSPIEVDTRVARAWAEGIATSGEIAASCTVDLGFEQYRFPGFPVPNGETAFSYLSELCWAGARKRYHPLSSAVMTRLAHELGVIERAGLAEFFLICWDLMRFAKEQGIPAQGRGSATSSIVSYTLGISRVEPIVHNLLFERFINEGRTTYPDVDIDFSSARREEVIQYVYRRYGPEHTGMVCNLVTYRARSAVREVGYALGFPRPLVDRVAKALETYDSVMVRRDLEAEGGFADFFRRPGEGLVPESGAAEAAHSLGFVDGMGQLNTRMPLVGKVPPWRQPPKPVDPAAPRPFAWLAEGPAPGDAEAGDAEAAAADTAASNTLSGTPSGVRLSQTPAPGTVDRESAGSTGAQVVEPRETVPSRAWNAMASVPAGAVDRPREPAFASNVPPARIGDKPGVAVGSGVGSAMVPGAGVAAGQTAPGPGPSASGMWEEAPESPPAVRPGGRGDDEGGPGDTPASVAWLRAGRGTGYGRAGETRPDADARPEARPAARPGILVSDGPGAGQDPGNGASQAPGTVDGRRIDPESGALEQPARRTDRLGRPFMWDPPAPTTSAMGRGGTARGRNGGGAAGGSSVARIEPEAAPQPIGGSTVGMSDWDRWLEFCARIDGFPRHLSIHSGGMLVTAAPLIDIAPIERATMQDRVVVQFDKRDVEELKLIKLDLLGLGMLAAIDETLQLIEHDCATCIDLDRMPEDIPEVFQTIQAADTVGVFQIESRAQMQT